MKAGADFIKTSTGKVASSHMVSLLLGMELMGVALYAMIAFPERGQLPLEGAIKYLVLSACASAMLLYGFAALEPPLCSTICSSNDKKCYLAITRAPTTSQLIRAREKTPMTFQYAPAPESTAIVNINSSNDLFINGEFTPGHGAPFKTINPATEEVLAEIAQANEEDVNAAVMAARKAYDKTWSKMSGRDRGKYLFRIARLIQERSRELAVLETLDNGKPIRESRDVDVPIAAAHFFYHAGWADKLEFAGYGDNPRPLGVVCSGDPVEFPATYACVENRSRAGNREYRGAQASRNTSLTALLFAEICQQADLPPGVVNIITGAGETGRMLVEHPDVNKVAFTGSTAVGQAIQRQIAGTHKRLTLELGGKAANIVFDDAPIWTQAVEGLCQRHLLQSRARVLRRKPPAAAREYR